MKRFLPLALLIVMFAVLPAGAMEAAVRDNAAVLSRETVSVLMDLNAELEEKTGYRITFDVRHFLGGAEAGAYAAQLLTQEQNSEKTMLLLAVIGEDRYAVAAGNEMDRAMGNEVRNTLLSRYFREPFQAREYDKALLDFARSAALRLAESAGVSLDGYSLPTLQPQNTAIPQTEYKSIRLPDLNEVLREPIRPTQDPQIDRQRSEREDRGLSIGSIVVIGLVLSALFGKNKNRRGCGCGPLGWIFGVFGISRFFGWRR